MTATQNDPPRRPGRPKNPISQCKLLEIAAQVFGESGYAGTSLSAIARLAGLRKASLFHHFPSKEALYLAMLGQILGDLGQLVQDAELTRGDFGERLDRLSSMVTDYLGSHPNAARILLRELIDQGPFMRGPTGPAVQMTLQMTSAFLRAGMNAGVFTPQDPAQLAISISSIHLVHFAAHQETAKLLDRDTFSSDAIAARKSEVLNQVRRLCGLPGI